jgi:hypothetical protein
MMSDLQQYINHRKQKSQLKPLSQSLSRLKPTEGLSKKNGSFLYRVPESISPKLTRQLLRFNVISNSQISH